MSYILNSYIEEVKDSLEAIENTLNNGSDNIKIKKLFDDVDKDISLLKLEFNSNNNKKDINNDTICKPLLLKYEQLKLQFNKSQLLGESSSTKKISTTTSPSFNKSNETREKVANINKMMENNKAMINQARQDVSSMTNVASEIITTLATQTEQMKNMDKKFDSIDAHLDNSNKTVDKMSKRWF